MKITTFALLLLGSLTAFALEQSPPSSAAPGGSLNASLGLPAVVKDGLDTYLKSGSKAAVEAWLKDAPLEKDENSIARVVGQFRQVEALYGKMTGFEEIRIVALTPSFKRVYILIKFERGPVFASFDCFRPDQAWIVPIFNFNTKANEVLPADMLSGLTR
jgi:hypothetical protein